MSGNLSIRQRDLELSCQLASVTTGRHFVRDTLLGWGLERLVEDAELGVSELVANAIRYAGTEVTLTVTAGDEVTIAVRDREPMLRRPVHHLPEDALAESGRGLRIVATVADDWGIQARPDGKSIWFSLALPDASTADAELVAFAQAPFPEAQRSNSRAAVVS